MRVTGRGKHENTPCWVGWILAVLAAAGCDEEEPDTCDRPSPNFFRNGSSSPCPRCPLWFWEGEPCWMNKCFPSSRSSRSRITTRWRTITIGVGAAPTCSATRTRMPAADFPGRKLRSCGRRRFRGVCVEYEDVCERTGGRSVEAGPRVCRPVPSAEGEWCDPSTCPSAVHPKWMLRGMCWEFSYQQTWDIDVVPEVERFIKFNMHSGVGKRGGGNISGTADFRRANRIATPPV